MELDMLESQVLSLIKSNFSERIKNKKEYKDLNFTTSDRVQGEARFPTVYVHMIDSSEAGGTLEGTDICGINAAFQIEVSDNKNNKRTDEISREILRIMKSLRFKAIVIPIHKNTQDAYMTDSRYQRVVGSGDFL